MLPVEVGDPELRAALADVREHLDAVGRNARSVTRVLGRWQTPQGPRSAACARPLLRQYTVPPA